MFSGLLPGAVLCDDWRSYKIKDGVSVAYKRQEGLLQIRAKVKLTSGMGAFLYLLEDTANISSWLSNSERAQLLGQPDAHTHIVHTYFTAPWPVSKRDTVTQSVWSQDPASGVLTLNVIDMGEHFAEQPGYVRMQQVQGQWQLTPLADGNVQIQYQGQANPGGKLPHFISDKVALSAIYSTFQQLPKVLIHYQRTYPGVVEP